MDNQRFSCLIRAFSPLPRTLSLSVRRDATIADLKASLRRKLLKAVCCGKLNENSGYNCVDSVKRYDGSDQIDCTSLIDSLRILADTGLYIDRLQSSQHDGAFVRDIACSFRLTAALPGGKGGFGSQLRAAGSRMSKRRGADENMDACRDLEGRRVKSVRQAQELAEWLAKAPKIQRETVEKKRQKLQAILNSDAGASRNATRFDSAEYFDECEKSVEAIKHALAKRKEQTNLDNEKASSSRLEACSSNSSVSSERTIESSREPDTDSNIEEPTKRLETEPTQELETEPTQELSKQSSKSCNKELESAADIRASPATTQTVSEPQRKRRRRHLEDFDESDDQSDSDST